MQYAVILVQQYAALSMLAVFQCELHHQSEEFRVRDNNNASSRMVVDDVSISSVVWRRFFFPRHRNRPRELLAMASSAAGSPVVAYFYDSDVGNFHYGGSFRPGRSQQLLHPARHATA